MKKNIILLAVVISFSGVSMAGSVMGTGGASEVTQLRNELELIAGYEQQVMGYVRQGLQLQNEIDNLIKNPFSILGKDVGGIINKVGKLMSGANSIASGVAQIDRNFATKFNAPDATTYAAKLTKWNSTSTATLDKVLASVDLHREDYESDTARIEAVVKASESNKGAAGALDTLRDINLLQIEHTRKLGELLATQNEAAATYMAGQIAKDEAVNLDIKMITKKDETPRPSIGTTTPIKWHSVLLKK